MKTYKEALVRYEEIKVQSWFQHDPFYNSIGIGKGDKGYFLEVGTDGDNSRMENANIKKIAGIDSDVRMVQQIVRADPPLGKGKQLKYKSTPIPRNFPLIQSGMGIVNQDNCESGTITVVLKKDDYYYAVSCHHIINCNNDVTNSKITLDTPHNNDVSNWIIGQIHRDGESLYNLDCTSIKLHREFYNSISHKIKFLGTTPKRIARAYPNLSVIKYGANTGKRTGIIHLIKVWMKDDNREYFQVNPNNTDAFANGGDSGALVMLKNSNAALGMISRSIRRKKDRNDRTYKLRLGLAIPIYKVLDALELNL